MYHDTYHVSAQRFDDMQNFAPKKFPSTLLSPKKFVSSLRPSQKIKTIYITHTIYHSPNN